MRFSFPIQLLFLCASFGLFLNPQTARAAFILDDFDDPAQVVSPEMQNDEITTSNVGDFDSERSMEINAVWSRSPPVGFLASNRDGGSQLTSDVNYLSQSQGSFKDVRFVLAYEFEETDATEGGRNNAILFEFERLVTTASDLSLRMFARDDVSGRFSVSFDDLSRTDSPFTLAIPLVDFKVGLAGIQANFEKLRRMSISFRAKPPQDSTANMQVEMALNSIRFGRIPEPSTLLLALGIVLVLACRRVSFQALFAVCFVFFLYPSSAQAAFILDDFDDPAEVVSPEMLNEFADTPNVGALNATRSIRVVSLRGNPDGHLDSSLTSTSILTGQLNQLNPRTAGGAVIAAVQTNYDFDITDLTESESNNALFFDFKQLTSEAPPSLFMILLNDTSGFFVHLNRVVPRSIEPFTLVVPFNSFTRRGGAPGLPDYQTIQSVWVELRASSLSGGGPDPLNFFVELDRIRVGKVPEPSLGCWRCQVFMLACWRVTVPVRLVACEK